LKNLKLAIKQGPARPVEPPLRLKVEDVSCLSRRRAGVKKYLMVNKIIWLKLVLMGMLQGITSYTDTLDEAHIIDMPN
jgi:hypothetical protein